MQGSCRQEPVSRDKRISRGSERRAARQIFEELSDLGVAPVAPPTDYEDDGNMRAADTPE